MHFISCHHLVKNHIMSRHKINGYCQSSDCRLGESVRKYFKFQGVSPTSPIAWLLSEIPFELLKLSTMACNTKAFNCRLQVITPGRQYWFAHRFLQHLFSAYRVKQKYPLLHVNPPHLMLIALIKSKTRLSR